jgi:hypothetical protein
MWATAVACYLGLAYAASAPYAAAALSGAGVLLGALGWLRWQALPGPERAYARRLAHTDARARAVVLLAAAGAVALVAIVPAAMLGALPAARAAAVLAVATVVGATVLAGRRGAT